LDSFPGLKKKKNETWKNWNFMKKLKT
jgi:hypothetical protein